MSMSRSGTVRANGQELYFEVHGEGPPLVFLQGAGYPPACLPGIRHAIEAHSYSAGIPPLTI